MNVVIVNAGMNTCAYYIDNLNYTRPRPIMLNFLPIILLSSDQKGTHYAQYYAHIANYCNYATVHTLYTILLFLMTTLA